MPPREQQWRWWSSGDGGAEVEEPVVKTPVDAAAAGLPTRAAAGGIAIALGANLPGPAGPPLQTLQAVRPLLVALLQRLGCGALRWSPLHATAAEGGPADQPDYLNAVVLAAAPAPADPLALLLELQLLEARFGRQRRERWGPRSLDLDLLWCGDHRSDSAALTLPHPRLQQRRFVLAPLAAIDPALQPPGSGQSCGELLQGLDPGGGAPPRRLAGSPGWPE
jgi:2-amino-4-hydroxy-6-hydroxymethyldihydropteridine diphosphokinase